VCLMSSYAALAADLPCITDETIRAAEGGDTRSQNRLGNAYFYGSDTHCTNGRTISKDDAEAVAWYRKAAEQGYAGGQNNLGVMYMKGRGIRQDDVEAVAWYRKAAEQGYAGGQNNLGWMYMKGP